MKTINLSSVKEKLIYEKLDNGLEIYILRKKDFNKSTARFFTKFGGLDLEFIPINEEKFVKMPSGIAHFLEHKLFEQESGISVDEFFNKSGSYVNAFTNYEKTCYHFTCNKNFISNLNFLLDFVQSPYFTDENVEKERGIIKQEALMELDNPNRKYIQIIYKNIFNSFSYDKPVIGSINDIKKISKNDLYRCYNTFYHPENMCLIIVTNEDEKKVLESVKENQSKKKFKKGFTVIKKERKEQEKVNKEYEVLEESVNETRVAYSLKLDYDNFKDLSKIELFYYLDIVFINKLGTLSDFNLKLKKDKIIINNISYDMDFQIAKEKTYIKITFYTVTKKIEEYLNLLEKELENLSVSNDDFNLIKKSIISNNLYSFNSIDGIMNYLYSEYCFTDKIVEDTLNIANNLKYEKLNEVIKKVNNKNKSIVIMKPRNE